MAQLNTPAGIISGREIAAVLLQRLQKQIASAGLSPHLVVVMVGDNPASQAYVKIKQQRAAELGIRATVISLPVEVNQSELEKVISDCNADAAVHGIIIQMPLPAHLDQRIVIEMVDPSKDVDGFHSVNVGRLHSGYLSPASGAADDYAASNAVTGFIPCTALGVWHLITATLGGDLAGRNALVIGRSNIVGRPTAALLLQENCTVTVAHSYTKNLQAACQRADILVAAVGRSEFIRGDWVKSGACVIDVGINRCTSTGKLIGDIAYDEVAAVAGYITPVPGGVGPMTVAYLLYNTFRACLLAS